MSMFPDPKDGLVRNNIIILFQGLSVEKAGNKVQNLSFSSGSWYKLRF